MVDLRWKFDWLLQVRGWIWTKQVVRSMYCWIHCSNSSPILEFVSQVCISDLPWKHQQTTRWHLFSRLRYRHYDAAAIALVFSASFLLLILELTYLSTVRSVKDVFRFIKHQLKVSILNYPKLSVNKIQCTVPKETNRPRRPLYNKWG